MDIRSLLERTLTIAFLLSVLSTAAPVAAHDLGGNNLIIPIAGSAPGAFGTQWRTDLVVTNLEAEPLVIYVALHDGTYTFTALNLHAFGTLQIDDVIGYLGRSNTSGILRVSSGGAHRRFIARAYIYNRGNPAGEFGQGVPAVPIDSLTQEHVMGGIVGLGGRRTNVGVANPWPTPADVILTMHGADGELLGQVAHTVAPFRVLQINDIFSAFSVIPEPSPSIRVHSSVSVYPYASIVRNDTGDAVFVPGSGVRLADTGPATACGEPAPIVRPYRDEPEAEESIVILQPGTSRTYVTNTIAHRHGLTIEEYFDDVPAFRAVLTPAQLATLRCESVVAQIRRDGALPTP
jgi:hypothetical protein